MTDREQFLTQLFTSPALAGDAAVILCGNDADERLQSGVQLLQRGFVPCIVLSGGRDEPPRHLSAQSLFGKAMGAGVAHSRIIVESESQNTAEQARACVRMALERGWTRLLVVASAYHLPRATLSFIAALDALQLADVVRILPVAASLEWSDKPEGCESTRAELFEAELRKVDVYRARGDCSSWGRGLQFLSEWECKP